jgi:HPt (histidine-containing phosphotransfer) domain-containing protein
MTDPIDAARLREFSDGTSEGLKQLSEMFVAHMVESANALRPAVDRASAEEIRLRAHQAAGTAGACGAQRLAGLLTRLERLGAEGQLEGATQLMMEIDEEVARVRAFLAGGDAVGGER